MQSFNLFDNQHGTFTANPIDIAGNPSSVTAETMVVDNTAILTLSDTAFANQREVRAMGAVGTATVTVSGTNAAGEVISTPFAFVISLSPATSFTGELAGVANN